MNGIKDSSEIHLENVSLKRKRQSKSSSSDESSGSGSYDDTIGHFVEERGKFIINRCALSQFLKL